MYIRRSDVETQVKRNAAIASLRPPAYTHLFRAPVFDFQQPLIEVRIILHHCPRPTRTVTGSMRLINIDAFLWREQLLHSRRQVERRTKVLELCNDKTTDYVILSHRWIDPTEVDYEEMVDLAKMDRQEQNEIRSRPRYKKIVDTCKQAKQDGYERLWVDTCCIDKRSSAELSEAINSMYRWYANSRICYAYLHDVPGSFPHWQSAAMYFELDGWPEWFSRGWTLQEMIAPQNLQFFNKDWRPIGDKKGLAQTLNTITGVPEEILQMDWKEIVRALLKSYRGPLIGQRREWKTKRTR